MNKPKAVVTPNTRDMFDFTPQQLVEAGLLLMAYKSSRDKTRLLSGPVAIELNPNSKTVFLVNSEYSSAILRNGELHDYLVCGCLNEGFRESLARGKKCCRYLAKLHLQVRDVA